MAWQCKPAIYRKPFRGMFFSCLMKLFLWAYLSCWLLAVHQGPILLSGKGAGQKVHFCVRTFPTDLQRSNVCQNTSGNFLVVDRNQNENFRKKPRRFLKMTREISRNSNVYEDPMTATPSLLCILLYKLSPLIFFYLQNLQVSKSRCSINALN